MQLIANTGSTSGNAAVLQKDHGKRVYSAAAESSHELSFLLLFLNSSLLGNSKFLDVMQSLY